MYDEKNKKINFDLECTNGEIEIFTTLNKKIIMFIFNN